MSEKIKLAGRDFDGLVGWALLRAMTKKSSGRALDEFLITPGNVDLEVCLTINGVEVSLKDTLDIWKEERDRLVRLTALRLIQDRFFKISEWMNRLERTVGSMVRAEFPDLYREGDGENDALELDLPHL